ncbi:flagellar export protein FliJ [Rugamonas sp.]|uniref:flagellar export protein FliJ n=1 Tax=Rugamonas sp. TaxID=1926287 RepID=UPI0025D77116|nr:flagellar export protein FliJ [Rugamonas sp.]
MASLSQLETLIDLARRASDAAAKRLGVALKAVSDAEEKKQMLIGYRDEYARRFEAAQQAGITPMAYRNFQAFMGKLENAINGQQEVLRVAMLRSGEEKTAWQESERKRLSYTTLLDRAAIVALKREAKLDQKQTDEHAARQAYYKR